MSIKNISSHWSDRIQLANATFRSNGFYNNRFVIKKRHFYSYILYLLIKKYKIFSLMILHFKIQLVFQSYILNFSKKTIN